MFKALPPHLHIRVLLLEVPAHPSDGASCAHTSHQEVHLALSGLPDLRACGLIVDAGVVGILKLLQDEGVGSVGGNLLSLGNSTLQTTRIDT